MKLKNNKGYVAIDASIAVLILLIIIPIIMGIVYNINKTNDGIDRKTEAISIALNTIEAIKNIGISGLNGENGDIFEAITLTSKLPYTLSEDGIPTIIDTNTYTKNISDIIIEKDENTYKVEVNIENYIDGEGIIIDQIKTMKVKVTYRLGKQEKDIDLSTVINNKE